MRALQLTGRRFGHWKVLEQDLSGNKWGNTMWRCRCKCGKTKSIPGTLLVQNRTRKCLECSKHSTWNSIPYALWADIIISPKIRGLRVSITRRYIYQLFLAQGGRCAYTGLPIAFVYGRAKPGKDSSTASLDRIDSTKGYVRGNVHWVHKDINRMKNAFSEKRFLQLCRLVAKRNNKKRR